MELKLYVGNQVFEKLEDFMTLEEFYEKSKEWIASDKSSWNHITLMAYFVQKYKKSYGINYRMTKWKNNPAKSKESLDMSKLIKEFRVSDNGWDSSKKNTILKCYNYINWLFDRKFKHDKKVNSTGLLLNHTLINEFEKIFNKKMIEFRSKNKVKNLKEWVLENVSQISEDYEFNDENDIKIFVNFFKSNNFDDSSDEFRLYNHIRSLE